MKLAIDTTAHSIRIDQDGTERTLPLYSIEAFELISDLWLKMGWSQKYPYAFSWMGRPIIQAPEDIVRVQEVLYRVKPDVLIETGVAHGGSLILYASLFRAMGNGGRVIGIDVEIRAHNLRAIEQHELSPLIALIEGSSIDPSTVAKVKALLKPGQRVMVILDSCHTKAHVRQELELYHELVTPHSYLVATDGSMKDLYDVPRGKPEWQWDNPTAAALEFAQKHPEFVIEQPAWPFNESALSHNITHWPMAYLRRLR